eukprot:13222620-Heterocapsa_arctica.AAC.1
MSLMTRFVCHRSSAPRDGVSTLASSARLTAIGGSCHQRDDGVIQVDVRVELQIGVRVDELLCAP